MVKAHFHMLISEFARAAGLSQDTVRFYVRRGLLKPLTGRKGGSNPYQVFSDEHVQIARMIRMGQSLGFSLREIEALNVEYQAKRLTASRGAEIMRYQLKRLEQKAAHVGAMMSYIRAKLVWLERGSKGLEPNFTDYELAANAKEVAPIEIAQRPHRKYAAAARAAAR